MNPFSFHFIGTRKHFFVDRKYYIEIGTTLLTMGANKEDKKPKYKLQLNLDTVIGWVMDQQGKQIIAFTFSWKSKQKRMDADPFDLLKMRETLKGRVLFSRISDFYEPKCFIGKGGQAQVLLAQGYISGEQVAVKSIEKRLLEQDSCGKQNLQTEISIMHQVSNLPHNDAQQFIQLKEVFEGDLSYFIVMQFLRGHTLADEIQNRERHNLATMNLRDIKIIIMQLLNGLKVLHDVGIIHRDIKPENIMFEDSGKSGLLSLKIVDFGLATRVNVDHYLYPRCGTPGFVAPEIINLRDRSQKYGPACDIFSVGSILFRMIVGKSLFKADTLDDMFSNDYQFLIDTSPLDNFDFVTRDVILKMLDLDPNERITAKEALNHDFFSDVLLAQGVSSQSFFLNGILSVKIINSALLKSATIRQQQPKVIAETNDINDGDDYEEIQIHQFPSFKKPEEVPQCEGSIELYEVNSNIFDGEKKAYRLVSYGSSDMNQSSHEQLQNSTRLIANKQSFKNTTLNSFYVKDTNLMPQRKTVQKSQFEKDAKLFAPIESVNVMIDFKLNQPLKQ